MNGRTAGLAFLGVCVILALLLLMRSIRPVLGGAIFAIALVVLGGLSRGFQRK